MTPYIIWDWNGTLLDDVDAAVSALNRMLADRGLSPATRGFYRAHFGFPARAFYEQLGMDPDDDWDQICIDFHRYIAEAPQSIRPSAPSALALARDLGFGQSILSALREDILRRNVTLSGIAQFFDEIYGVDNLDGASKLSRGHELVSLLRSNGTLHPLRPLYFVGDTLHDAEVAAEMGATAVLVDGGHQTAERLAATGLSVVHSPTHAVRHIASLCKTGVQS
jgi:phosphoglycolate phosphatase